MPLSISSRGADSARASAWGGLVLGLVLPGLCWVTCRGGDPKRGFTASPRCLCHCVTTGSPSRGSALGAGSWWLCVTGALCLLWRTLLHQDLGTAHPRGSPVLSHPVPSVHPSPLISRHPPRSPAVGADPASGALCPGFRALALPEQLCRFPVRAEMRDGVGRAG